MGLFLSMASVVGRGQTAVTTALQDFAMQAGAAFRPAAHPQVSGELCVVKEEAGNTTIFFADPYSNTAETVAGYLSRRLAAPTFYLHLHDDDLWLYVLYANGEVVDQFNPMPGYWDEDLSEPEAANWRGNAATLASYLPALPAEAVANYLVRWDDEARPSKAYPDDEHGPEAWQLLDFMRRLHLPYPIGDDGPDGQLWRLGQ